MENMQRIIISGSVVQALYQAVNMRVLYQGVVLDDVAAVLLDDGSNLHVTLCVISPDSPQD